MSVHVFGIRHHGPGSARSLRRALETLAPDIVLIEGPPDASALLGLVTDAEMRPPVAILIYDPDAPRRAVYYPFALFSPEWQAISYALTANVPVRFIDLPQANRFGLQRAAETPPDPAETAAGAPEDAAGNAPQEAPGKPDAGASVEPDAVTPAEPQPETPAEPVSFREDPLDALARAAGFGDGERWWEELVEQRRSDADVFAAVLEAMSALREELALPVGGEEARREAYMRQQVRAAEREGFQRVAVVCGAWHAPVLATMPAVKEDAALLRGMPKAKVAATWVPWTYGRLAYASGYGAGVRSPGWYDYLWTVGAIRPEEIAAGWMTRVTRLLRDEDLDASPAQAVDATRLAEALAAFRGLPLPGLAELNEAAGAVFWSGAGGAAGSSLQLRLIEERLIVGDRLGVVPSSVPAVPLQQDVTREQKRLRLPPETGERLLELDLRKPNDLDRSRLLHRLNLLGIAWGRAEGVHGAKGTFREAWRVRWDPEFVVELIEASIWGNTVAEAASGRARDTADQAANLPALAALLDAVLIAELPDAAQHILTRIRSEAALATDTTHLMQALPPLANVLRYGNVRGGSSETLAEVVDGLVARICIGLLPAAASLDDDAASAMLAAIEGTHGGVTLLEQPQHLVAWLDTLRRLLDQKDLHGLLAGRSCRLLLDAGAVDPDEATRRMRLALSRAAAPEAAGAWVEGFLRGSGLVLLHDAALWRVLDRWVSELPADAFTPLLPLLRRTFATFPAGERRMLGELARSGGPGTVAGRAASTGFDAARAAAALPLVAALLGLDIDATEPTQ